MTMAELFRAQCVQNQPTFYFEGAKLNGEIIQKKWRNDFESSMTMVELFRAQCVQNLPTPFIEGKIKRRNNSEEALK